MNTCLTFLSDIQSRISTIEQRSLISNVFFFFRRPSDEYEISKYQVLKPDETREL